MGSSMVTIALLEASLNARMVRHLTANSASPISSPSVNQGLFSIATGYVSLISLLNALLKPNYTMEIVYTEFQAVLSDKYL
jgi:hypothetical protein